MTENQRRLATRKGSRSQRKRVLTLAVATASLVTLAACGNGSNSASSGGETEITYWTSATEPKVRQTTMDIVADFEEANPGITVDVQIFPFGEYFDKVSIAFGGGNPPDVLWVDSTLTRSYGEQGLLSSLEPHLDEGEKEDFFPNPLEDMTYEGEVQSLALHQSTEALVYVKSVVEEAGVTPPTSYSDAWTFDEMAKAMHAVQDSGIDWGYSPTYGIGQYSVYPFIEALGGSVYDREQETFSGALDSPETADAVRKWASLYTSEGLAPLDIVPDMLGTKQVAFQQTNPFTMVDVSEKYPDLELGAAPLPCDETCAVASGGWHVGIAKTSDNQDAAWKLVEALAGREGGARWSEATHYLPARQSAFEANEEWIGQEPWSLFWEGLENHAVPRPRTANFQLYANELDAVLRDASRGTDPGSGLATATEKLQQAAE